MVDRRPLGSSSFFGARERPASSPREPNASLQPGQEIGDFRLLQWIASGGMGQVWEAEQKSLRRNVALKLLLPGRVEPTQLALFEREARAGGRLHHGNLVETHAHGTDGGHTWIAQELVQGSWTLRDFLDDMRAADELPAGYYRSVSELLAKLADALSFAHSADVIHRDVKPQNILIAPDDEPKLTDFGLARLTDEAALTQTGDFAGTYFYMSPEQVTAKRMGIDHRTDVFSLGVVMYELLTLRKPFEGDTTHQICSKIVTWDPPDPRRVRSQCPADLAVICAKTMEKAPADRYPSMEELAADLRRFLSHEPIHARPQGVPVRVKKWTRRNPGKATALGVAAAAFTAVSALSLALENKANELAAERDNMLAKTYVLGLRAASSEFSLGRIEEARNYLQGCPPGLRGWEWHHLLLRLDQSSVTTPLSGRTEDIRFSPDGRRVAVATTDGLALLDTESGQVVERLLVGSHVVGVDFSPDGTLLVVAVAKELYVWEASSSPLTEPDVVPVPDLERDLNGVAFSPDSDALFVGSYSTALRLSRPDWQVVQALPGPVTGMYDLAVSPKGDRVATSYWGQLARLWEPAAGELVADLRGHRGQVRAVDFDRTGTVLATAGGTGISMSKSTDLESLGLESLPDKDDRILLWSADTGESLGQLTGHEELVSALAFDPAGSRLASTSLDGALMIWNVEERRPHATLRGHASRALDWHGASGRIATGSTESLKLWDADYLGPVVRLGEDPDGVTQVAWSKDGSRLASACWDNAVRIRDAATGELLLTLENATSPAIQTLAFSPDDRLLATAVGVFDIAGREQRISFGDAAGFVAFDPRGGFIAVGTSASEKDGRVRIVELDSGEMVRELEGHHPFYSADGSLLAIAPHRDQAKIVTLLDSDTFAPRWEVEVAQSPVAFLPNGSALVVQREGRLILLSTADGRELGRMEGQATWQVVPSPDGTRLFGCSLDTVVVWHVESGDRLATFELEQQFPHLAVSPTGLLAIGYGRAGIGGEVEVWASDEFTARQLWVGVSR